MENEEHVLHVTINMFVTCSAKDYEKASDVVSQLVGGSIPSDEFIRGFNSGIEEEEILSVEVEDMSCEPFVEGQYD